jgi:predicted nucleic acid-binding protein
MVVPTSSHKRLYFDSNIFITLLEKPGENREDIFNVLAQIEAWSQVIVTSELTLAECLVGAHRINNTLVETYERLLQSNAALEVIPITRKLLLAGSKIAADRWMKFPDALHCATAEAMGCTALVSNDKGLRLSPGMTQYSLDDLLNS